MSSQIPLRKYGVSKYPPATPLIGQSDVHDKLQTFLSDTEDDEPGNYFIFGDWGSGKSRIGHQILAEATNKKSSWWISEGNDFVERPILEEVEPAVFPIKLPLPDFINKVDADTAALIAFNSGMERLIDSDEDVYEGLRDELESRNVQVLELRKIMESGKTPTEKMKAYQDILYDSDQIDRIVLIVDEVEDIDQVAEQSPEEVTAGGVSRTRLRVFLAGLKRMVNPEHELYDGAFNVSLLLLCTLNVEREMEDIGGFDRRNYRVTIDRPQINEAVHLMNQLQEQYEEIEFSDDCAKALFFAAYNNYGWFFSTLYLLLVHQNQGQNSQGYDEIMRSSPGAFDTLFNQSVTEDIKNHREVNQTVRDQIIKSIYRLSPTPISDIQTSPDELVAYQDPSVTRPLGYQSSVDLSLSELKKQLIKKYDFTPKNIDNERILEYQNDQIEIQTLTDALTVFQTEDGKLLLYQNETDLRELAKFISKGDLSQDTADRLIEFFTDIQSDDPDHIGPTIQFLVNWSNRWKAQDEILQWLRDTDKWTLLNQAVRDIQGRGDEEILRGFLYTRFEDLRKEGVDISANSDLTHPNFTFDIESDSLASAAPNDTGVGLIYTGQRNSTSDLKSDITQIKQEHSKWPMVYLLFDSDEERTEVMQTISNKYPHFSKFIVAHTVEQIGGDAKFYKRFSYLNREYDDEVVFDIDDLNNFGRDRLRQKLEKIRSTDLSHFNQLRDDGWFIKPVLPSHMQIDAGEYLVKGINHFAQGANQLQDGTFTGTESTRIGNVWQKYRDDKEELLTFVTDENNLQVPSEVIQILSIIESNNQEITSNDLAGKMFYDSEYRADVKEVTKNILEVLVGIGAVARKNDGYILCNKSYLNNRIQKTKKKLSNQRGTDDERLDEITDILLDPVLGEFKIRKPKLNVYKKKLEEANEDLSSHSFDRLTAQNPGEEWYKTTTFIVETLDLCNQGYDPSNEFTNGGPQPAKNIPEDGNFAEYSRCYRIEYLYWLQSVVSDFEQSILQEISDRKNKIKEKYEECNGEPFPTQVIKDLLENMESDIRREDVDLNDELTDCTDSSFYDHLQVPQLEEVFTRMTWYNNAFEHQDLDDDPWSRYVSAHSTLEEALSQWPDVVSAKTRIESFLEDSKFEDDLLETELSLEGETVSDSINGQWNPLKKICDNPKEELKSKDLDGLNETVNSVLAWAPKIKSHCEDVEQDALNELDEQREELPMDELEKLCSRVSTDSKIDMSEISNEDRYIDRELKIDELNSDINERGKEVLDNHVKGGNKLWEFYKNLYKDTNNNNPITSKTYTSQQQTRLDTLASDGIIDKEEITNYDISL